MYYFILGVFGQSASSKSCGGNSKYGSGYRVLVVNYGNGFPGNLTDTFSIISS